MDFQRFGIIGLGHFGRFMAESLRERGEVIAYDSDPQRLRALPNGTRSGSLAEIGEADVAVVAVPYSSLLSVLLELREVLSPSTVVMDVVSTKAMATGLLQEVLGSHAQILATHPLFGPPSMQRMGPGNRLVVSHAQGHRAEELERYLKETFGLELLQVQPDEHDRAMAYMQALPFFIARALVSLDIKELTDPHGLELPSFEKLMAIAAIEQHHTPEMFDTSQRSNPYAQEARDRFLRALQDLNDQLEAAATDDPLPMPGQLKLPESPRDP